MNIQAKIIGFLTEQQVSPKTNRELAEIFEIDRKQRKTFYALLQKMEREGLLFRNHKNRYGVKEQFNLIQGHFIGNGAGFGFVPREGEEDIFIPKKSTAGAMHGDTVLVRLVREKSGRDRDEGEIVRILVRKNETLVGVFAQNKTFGFVIPDQKKIGTDIFIAAENMNEAQDGDKVVLKITRWAEEDKNPEGKIIEIIGSAGDVEAEIEGIIKKFELKKEFSEEMVNRAKSILAQGILPESLKTRRDFRDNLIFTIDGQDAKDLDDAVSIEVLPSNQVRLGVHIADVSHYIKERSLLDQEALERGTSVYFPDRVLPMFPKEISNGICSLSPEEDRLCLSVIMDIDAQGKVTKNEIKESIINSKYRLNYTEVSDFLDTKADTFKGSAQLAEALREMEKLSKHLFQKRKNRGAIDFEFDEIYIDLDEQNQVKGLKKRDRRIGHRIIEEFMLLCNETVAEQFFWMDAPFVYRIHEEPNEEKIKAFNQFVRQLGYTLKGQMHAKNFQMLLEEVKEKKEGFVIATLLLRSMQKARYTHYQDIHFGLSCNYYTHFTSPIRRYPDLQVHRIVKDFIQNRLNEEKIAHYDAILGDVTAQNSKSERGAQEAERECDDLFMAIYMKDHVGETFRGNVSGITSFGMFVRLENLVEGLVPLSLMSGYYIYDEDTFTLREEKGGRVFHFGDEVQVRVKNVSIQTRNIDLILEDEDEDAADL